jgi:hypothetical protein
MIGNSEPWKEELPSLDHPVNNALIAIAACSAPGKYLALGTGFIVGIEKDVALAFSAAHVFEQIFRIQNPQEPKPPNLLFRTDPQKIDLDPELSFAILVDKGRNHHLAITNLYYDLKSDVAIFNVKKVKPDNRIIFHRTIRRDFDLPPVGTQIEGIGFKKMEFTGDAQGRNIVRLFRSVLTRRTGTVTEVHQRTMRSDGPGATASFPIFGGMSGGPVLRVDNKVPSAAFGIMNSDFEDSDEQKHDVNTPGCTTVSKLPITKAINAVGNNDFKLRFSSMDDEIGTGLK